MDEALARFKSLLAGIESGSDNAGCDLLLATLAPDLAHCFRLCAIPHQFDRELLTILVPTDDAAKIDSYYESLSRLALVSVHGTSMALHDTARKYLFGKWLHEAGREFADVSARLWSFFDRELKNATGQEQDLARRKRMFHQIGSDQDQGIAEFELLCRENRRAARFSEFASLIALVHEYDPVLTEQNRNLLIYQEGKLASDRRDWGQAEALFGRLIADQAASEAFHMKAYNRLALAYLAERRWDEALKALDGAEKLSARVGTPSETLLILNDKALAYRGKGLREQSESLLKRAVEIAKKNPDPLCQAKIFNSLGTLHRSRNEHREAIAAYEKSLEFLNQAGDRFRSAAALNNLADEYSQLADWEKSQTLFERSLDISREAADTVGQARALANLSRVYWSRGRPEEALAAGQTAASYFSSVRDHYSAGIAILRVARFYRSLKKTESADDSYDQAIAFLKSANATGEAADVEKERAALARPPGLPRWVWVLLVLGGLFFLLIAILVGVAENQPGGG